MTTVSDQWTYDMRETLRDLQRQTVLMTLPVIGIAGLSMLLLAINTAKPVWGVILAFGLFALMPLAWLVSKNSFGLASGFLICGSWACVLAVTAIWQVENVLFLLIIPVGLATMALGTWGGALALGASAWMVVFPPPFLQFLSPSTPTLVILCLVSVWGMVWLTLTPLLTSIRWAWTSYHKSISSLSQAQEFQAKLQQTLQDMSFVTSQLKRQKEIADRLRALADDERRAKQEFVATVSHELRTPLNMVIGFSSNILAAPEMYAQEFPAKLLADLQVILRNSQHLSDLIDDVLDLSQIDANRMVLNKQQASLVEIIESAVLAVRPLFESKRLALTVDYSDQSLQLWCDPTRIREVMLNLFSNAGRFTEQGGVQVKVMVEREDVVVSVSDTGPGISKENQQKLFEPFQQADGSIRRKYGGSGLGLSISKGLVELHNGKMWVESRLGQGTTFYFRLPLSEPVPLTSSTKRWFNPYLSYEDVRHVTKMPELDERPRLVLVEQSPVLHKLVSRHAVNAVVDVFTDLALAMKNVSESGAQCLLINLPNIETVVEQLQGLPEGIPSLVCSLPGIEQGPSQTGVVDILTKPLSREALARCVANLNQPIKSVLVIDDDPDMRQLCRRILYSNDATVRVLRAGDGLEALEILSHEQVDLILLDIMMPRMDGIRFLQEFGKDPETKKIPIIMITARDRQGQPIVANALTVTHSGGISATQLLDCMDALLNVLAPAAKKEGVKPDAQASPAALLA